jgi:hypothetical protein
MIFESDFSDLLNHNDFESFLVGYFDFDFKSPPGIQVILANTVIMHAYFKKMTVYPRTILKLEG